MNNPNDDARPNSRAVALGAAVRRFRGDRSQAELGELLGERQTTVSRWEAGMVDLSYDQVHRIEAALALPFGTLGWAVGYIEVRPGAHEGPVKELRFDTLLEAHAATEAAADLGFGVTLTNRWSVDDEREDTSTEVWVLEITAELPYEDIDA